MQGLCCSHKAKPSWVSSCSPTFLAHLPGFHDLLLQLLFLALEVLLGAVFLLCFALSLCPVRYCLSVRNTHLHGPNQHLLLLQQLPIADLPLAKTQKQPQNTKRSPIAPREAVWVPHPTSINQIHVT